MQNNNKKINTLIKKNQLIKILKKEGIKRFKKGALKSLEQKIMEELKKDSQLMARRLMLEGRKTLTEKDVNAVMGVKNEKESGFEI